MIKCEMLPGEVFKDIDGFEEYAISNKGRLYSYKTNKILSQQTANKYGAYPNHKYVRVTKGKEYHNLYIHLAVVIAFIPNTGERKKIGHIDGDCTNNSLDNLELIDIPKKKTGRPKKYTEDWIHYRLGLKKFQGKTKTVRNPKKVICTNYGIEFDSTSRAGEIIEASTQAVRKACETGTDIHGLYFSFVEQDQK